MLEKLKSFLADDALFMAILLLLVGVVSFGLGRQSVVGEVVDLGRTSPAGIIFTEAPSLPPADTAPLKQPGAGQVVASRSGSKYHLPNCPGASQIKQENKVYFDTIALAEAAGYTAAANCPGL